MPLGQLIKKINKENAPPDGWRPEDKATSYKQQAASFKQQALDKIGLQDYIRHMKDEKLRQDLELLKTDELIDIIIDQSQQLEKHEEKERHNAKQGKYGY